MGQRGLTRRCQGDDHFVHDADDRVVANVAVRHFGRVVSEDTEAVLHAGDILGRLIDQEIEVFRETARAVSHDREAGDEHAQRTGGVQRATDADEVFLFG